MRKIRTIEEIEAIDIDILTNSERAKIMDQLRDSFYKLDFTELTDDGRCLKEVVTSELARFISHDMSTGKFSLKS